MKVELIKKKLPVGSLGQPLYFFTTITSTNDYAKELAEEGAPHGTLVVADEQTAGRGRWQREWFTPAGSALALTLILRPQGFEADWLPAINVLGALAVSQSVGGMGARAQIKWPNDVLINGKKVAGVLAEAGWHEQALDYVVIGIGVNVKPESVPPSSELQFPASSLHQELPENMARTDLLLDILDSLDGWLARLPSEALVKAWNQRLAYVGEQVQLQGQRSLLRGTLLGVAPDGRLELEVASGQTQMVGEDFIHLRRVDRNQG